MIYLTKDMTFKRSTSDSIARWNTIHCLTLNEVPKILTFSSHWLHPLVSHNTSWLWWCKLLMDSLACSTIWWISIDLDIHLGAFSGNTTRVSKSGTPCRLTLSSLEQISHKCNAKHFSLLLLWESHGNSLS